MKRKNLKLKWFPSQCWKKIPLNTYVVIIRNKLRKIKYLIEIDDHRGVDAATLEFFSIQTHRKSVSFSVNDKRCKPLTRKQIETYKDS